LQHESEVTEDGHPRRVQLEIEWLLVGQSAHLLAAAPLGAAIEARGFLAPKARTRQQLVLHITEFELHGD
jgi:primosomal replication protein N